MSCEKTDISFAFWMQENLSFLFLSFFESCFPSGRRPVSLGSAYGEDCRCQKTPQSPLSQTAPPAAPGRNVCRGSLRPENLYNFSKAQASVRAFFSSSARLFHKSLPAGAFWGPDFCGTCSIASKILGKFFYDPPKIDHFPTICTFHKGTFAFWCAILSYGAPEKSGAGKRKN